MDEWQIQEEVPVVDNDDYYFALEEYRRGNDQMVFVHLTVHKWTPRVFKELIKRWKQFREYVTCPLYAVGGVEDVEKWEAFVSLLGFKFLMNVVCENGAERRLFIHNKENNKNERKVLPDDKLVRHSEHTAEPVGSADTVSEPSVQRS